MTPDQQSLKRIQRVRSAGWLSFTDMCAHCNFGETKMRELMLLPDFPRPSQPTGSPKESRWSKAKVDAWLEAHELESVGDVTD